MKHVDPRFDNSYIVLAIAWYNHRIVLGGHIKNHNGFAKNSQVSVSYCQLTECVQLYKVRAVRTLMTRAVDTSNTSA